MLFRGSGSFALLGQPTTLISTPASDTTLTITIRVEPYG